MLAPVACVGAAGEGACVGAAMNAGGRFCGDPGGGVGACVGAGGEGACVGADGACVGSNMGVAASYASAAAMDQSESNRINCMRWSQPMHVTVQHDGENIMARVGIGGHFSEVEIGLLSNRRALFVRCGVPHACDRAARRREYYG